MLRVISGLIVALAVAGPALAGDIETCRDQKPDFRTRMDACEKVIAAAQATGQVPNKDLGFALAMRGHALIVKHDNDKAITTLNAAHDADPDNPVFIDARGVAYERKGQDDLALADFNRALQIRPTFGSAYNNRGVLHLREGAYAFGFEPSTHAVGGELAAREDGTLTWLKAGESRSYATVMRIRDLGARAQRTSSQAPR